MNSVGPQSLLSRETLSSTVTDHQSGVLSDLDRRVIGYVKPGGNWRDLPDDFPSRRIQQIRASAAAGAGSRSTYYGRLNWDLPSYTISTYFTRPGNGCFIHPTEARLLTVREAARLQTFPDAWRFAGTIRQRAMQIGNAVPPLMAMQVASMFAPGSAVDLFSGAGGLSLGLTLAGHELIAAVDHDKRSVEAHNRNLGEHAFEADLDTVDGRTHAWDRIKSRTHEIELVAGGPPCQGFSTAGNAAKDDPRNRLVWSFVEGVERLAPRNVIMENVVALAQSRGRAYLASVRRELEKMGYVTEYAILHAEAYGVPQLRRRVVLAAARGRLPSWVRPWRSMRQPSFASAQPEAPTDVPAHTVREALSDLPGNEAAGLDAVVKLDEPKSQLQRWLRGDYEVFGVRS